MILSCLMRSLSPLYSHRLRSFTFRLGCFIHDLPLKNRTTEHSHSQYLITPQLQCDFALVVEELLQQVEADLRSFTPTQHRN